MCVCVCVCVCVRMTTQPQLILWSVGRAYKVDHTHTHTHTHTHETRKEKVMVDTEGHGENSSCYPKCLVLGVFSVCVSKQPSETQVSKCVSLEYDYAYIKK